MTLRPDLNLQSFEAAHRIPFFAFLVSWPDKKLYFRANGKRLRAKVVTEAPCSAVQWDQALINANIRGFKYEIHGRRRGYHVELFHTPGQKETPHLRAQYVALNFHVTSKQFPASLVDECHIMAQVLLNDFVKRQSGKLMPFGLLLGSQKTHTLVAVYACREILEQVQVEMATIRALPTLDNGRYITLGTVWCENVQLLAGSDVLRPYFNGHVDGTVRIQYAYGKDLGVSPGKPAELNTCESTASKEQAAIAVGQQSAQQLLKKSVSETTKQKKKAYQGQRKAHKRAEKAAEIEAKRRVYQKWRLLDIGDEQHIVVERMDHLTRTVLSTQPGICRRLGVPVASHEIRLEWQG